MTLLGLALLGMTTAHAGDIPDAEYKLQLPKYDLQLTDYVFPSGLRIIFQEEHTQPIVSVTSVVDHGSGSDPEPHKGIAHFVEHLNFRAQHGDLPKNWDLIEQLGGGSFNAYTNKDRTVYLTSGPRDSLVPLLRLEALRVSANTLEGVKEEDLDVEREVVRNELRLNYENEATSDAYRDVHRMLFPPGHPYHVATIGTNEGIDRSDLEAAVSFTDQFYRPEYTTIVVVGDFELEQSGEFIQQAFGDLPELITGDQTDETDEALGKSEATVRLTDERPPVPDPVEFGPVTVQGNVDTPTVVTAWSLPGTRPEDEINMYLASQLLNGAVVRQLLREYDPYKDDPPENIGCFMDGAKEASLVLCFAEPQQGMSSKQTIKEITKALYEVWKPLDVNDLISRQLNDWYFSNTRSAYMADTLRSADEVASIFGGRSSTLAEHAHYTGSAMYFSDSFDQLSKMNLDVAREIARQWFVEDRMVSVIVEPMSDEEKARREATMGDEHAYHGDVHQHDQKLIFDLDTLTEERIADLVITPDTSTMRQLTLDNGLEVTIVPYGEVPVVRAGLFVAGSSQTSDPVGLDALAEAITDKGYKREATQDLGAVAGAQYEGSLGYGRQLWAEGSSGNLDAVLHSLRLEVDQQRVLPADKKMAVRNARRSMLRSSKKPEDWISRIREERLYPDHPLGMWFDSEHYESRYDFGIDQVKRWMSTKYQPANAQLVVVGAVDPEVAEAEVQRMFGGWEKQAEAGEPIDIALPPLTQQPERQILLFDKKGVTQHEVFLYCQSAPVTHDRVGDLQITGDVLGERTWDVLREQEGLTYAAYAGGSYYPGGAGYFMGMGLVQSDAVGFSVDALLKLFADTAEGANSAESIAEAKWARARAYVLGHQSGSAMLQRLQATQSLGLGMEFFDEYPMDLASVSNEDISHMLEPCIGHEVITVLGPVETAQAQLTEYGYDSEIIDADALYESQLTAKELKKHLKAKAKAEKKKARDESQQ